ncbi:NAD/FAD-binding protein [Yasminevirus sp. GU-2018]|uniref:NAD/FAD-binding protein n=1 Tax=Yasminevirus sp. GU-2018 TaxID=2420051 RepID=A0A5K0U8R5_9VIRU|nr:NAD/FAD-binding protein [Yasminevirus sp. GU-2018]
MTAKKVVVVGSGISGLSACYNILKDNNDQNLTVTLLEKENRVGGHSYTIDLKNEYGDKIDIGFQVFNEHTYPEMLKMFSDLGVETMKSDMSLSVKYPDFEWGSNNLMMLTSPTFLWLMWEMYRFNNCAYDFLKRTDMTEEEKFNKSIDDFCNMYSLTYVLRDYYLIPLIASVWSASSTDSGQFGAYSILRFMDNHHLLHFTKYQWLTMKNRSDDYVSKLISRCGSRLVIKTGVCVDKIDQAKRTVKLTDSDHNDVLLTYDCLVVAVHGDRVLKLFDNPTEQQQKILSKFSYSEAEVSVHRDSSIMPKNRWNWTSWNYSKLDDKPDLVCTYWPKMLQSIKETDVFVSLNHYDVPQDKTIMKIKMQHPKMNNDCLSAQREINAIQGVNNVWYAGAYLINGFHEDGYVSGMNSAKAVNSVLKQM